MNIYGTRTVVEVWDFDKEEQFGYELKIMGTETFAADTVEEAAAKAIDASSPRVQNSVACFVAEKKRLRRERIWGWGAMFIWAFSTITNSISSIANGATWWDLGFGLFVIAISLFVGYIVGVFKDRMAWKRTVARIQAAQVKE